MGKKLKVLSTMIILLFLFSVSYTFAETGDSIEEAEIASLGDHSRSLDSYNDAHWFNFTGERFYVYNISLDLEDDANYITLYLYDENQTLIDKSTSGTGDRFLNATGYSKYLILVSSSEFVNSFPANFVLTISVLESPEDGISTSLGETKASLKQYNDEQWFIFNGKASNHYNFTLDLEDDENYIKMFLYDLNWNIINKSTSGFGDRTLNATGYAKYFVLVSATEFVNAFPANLTLKISIKDDGSVSDDDSNNGSQENNSDNSNTGSTETEENNPVDDILSVVPFPFISTFIILIAIPIFRKYKN